MKRAPLLFFLFLSIQLSAQINSSSKAVNKGSSWLPAFDFNPVNFQKPEPSFGPMARWWWPGNFVTKEELKREINVFADNGFAGVEVQPMKLAIPTASTEEKDEISSWDTPEYYYNLKAVLEEARRRNLIIDMTNGSGWPPSSPILTPEDGLLSLEFSDTTVVGGKTLSFALPVPGANKNRTKVTPKLQAVVIAKVLQTAEGATETVKLDAASTKVLKSEVKNSGITYKFPEGNWRVIAFWAVPSGEYTNIAAMPKQAPVVDHLHSQKVLSLYEYLFGDRTGLQPYYGNPIRAVFSDSYEFKANRHYPFDFLTYFKKHRGHDITPYLPANMQKGYNYVAFARPHTNPDFSFSAEQDRRLRYDYDITISELFGEHFFKTSKSWTEDRGMLFRTQGYGLNMDMMALAGMASIPETENMLGPEAVLKIMTSGALLYNRPIVTAEAVVFSGRAYTNTPQKIKLAVDKLFAAGVNQVIYHGVPYRYTPVTLGPEGWYPFSSPFLGQVNFSSNLGEGNIFWKDQKTVNEYVSRVQYALRSGKPRADVLIYFPFLDVEGTPDNEEEIMTKGYLKEMEGPLPKTKEEAHPAKEAWAKVVYPLINKLEAAGISWSWVNDASLQEARLEKDGRINIRGNQFGALILANDSIIGLPTAEKIKQLASKGMRLLGTGVLPTRQPSFLNWEKNDKKTAQYIVAAFKAKNSRYTQNESELDTWIKEIAQPIRFQGNYSFTRKAEREMQDGSRMQFIWNKSNAWQTISLALDQKFSSSYWLDPTSGAVTKNNGSSITYQIPPYGSVLFYASTQNTGIDAALSSNPVLVNPKEEVLAIKNWNLQVDSVELKNTQLLDWRNQEKLKFSSSNGNYTSTFQWAPNNASRPFFLDLGQVSYTAEVYINKELVGKRIYAPYLFDITKFLKTGANTIEVRITPGQLNGFIGKAQKGDNRYRQFKGEEDQLMSAGLLGPVVIRPGKE